MRRPFESAGPFGDSPQKQKDRLKRYHENLLKWHGEYYAFNERNKLGASDDDWQFRIFLSPFFRTNVLLTVKSLGFGEERITYAMLKYFEDDIYDPYQFDASIRTVNGFFIPRDTELVSTTTRTLITKSVRIDKNQFETLFDPDAVKSYALASYSPAIFHNCVDGFQFYADGFWGDTSFAFTRHICDTDYYDVSEGFAQIIEFLAEVFPNHREQLREELSQFVK